MIMVDTTIWVDFFRNSPTSEHRALERLLVTKQMVCLTDIIQTEILQGIQSDQEHERILHFLTRIPCLTAKAPATFEHAAQLYRQCRKNGVTIRSTIDCLIAAVCLENNASLLHHDTDFDQLTKHCGLKKANPSTVLQ